MKYDFAFFAVGDAGKKGVFYTFLKFQILCSGIEVSVAHPRFSDTVLWYLGGHEAHTEDH